jgi:hypothetical protein
VAGGASTSFSFSSSYQRYPTLLDHLRRDRDALRAPDGMRLVLERLLERRPVAGVLQQVGVLQVLR